MAIHQEEIQEVQGFDKEIEQSALGMILDNLQMYQYQYPQKSTIRELVSNALDAVKEKQIALSILKGESKVEDHFVHRDEALYQDSNFDASYYNAHWLWWDQTAPFYKSETLFGKSADMVYVTYVDGGDRDKDKILIEDFGVGLGGKRLEGYFKLGYSTKRNTKSALGKFGIGAKAALSTAPYYVMTTRYNGREYSFQIYSHKIVSIVPQFDLDSGKSNGVHMFQNGAIIYFRETSLPNGTTIEVEAKKHHKQLYIDAVKSQLLYFDNVEFRVKNANGGTDVVSIKATILYEDDYIVLSDNNQYSKPHLLINKVNYGYVDFRELELEDVHGNIGIKVAAEEVTVNPSRESVIWNEQTRETVVNRFRTVVNIAEHMISEQLKVEDFIDWLKACSEISARFANSNSIVGRLSRIVDLSRAKIKYCKDSSIEFDGELFACLEARTTKLETKRTGSVVKYHIERYDTGLDSIARGLPIIVQSTRSSFKKDKYLLQEVYPNGFISVRLRYHKLDENEEIDMSSVPEEYITELTIKQKELITRLRLTEDEFKDKVQRIEQYITESANIIPYGSIVVPEDFDDKEEIEEEITEEQDREEKLSAEARRKLNGTIPIYTPRVVYQDPYVPSAKTGQNEVRLYEWQKMEIPVKDIDTWDDEEVFFATDKVIGKDNGKDVLESELLHLAACITRPNDDKTSHAWRHNTTRYGVSANDMDRCTHFWDANNKKIKLIKVAQDRRKYFTDFKPIQRFFLDIKNKTLTMSNALIRWNTARIMHSHFERLKFLENFGIFHYKHSATYRNLKAYVETNYRAIDGITSSNNYYGLKDSGYSDLINHCDKVMKLQLLARDFKDKPELIAKAVTEMFNPSQEVIDGCAVDIVLYDQLNELLEYAAPICTLLNEMYVLTFVPKDGGAHKDISEKLEHDIREYLTFKGVEMQ